MKAGKIGISWLRAAMVYSSIVLAAAGVAMYADQPLQRVIRTLDLAWDQSSLEDAESGYRGEAGRTQLHYPNQAAFRASRNPQQYRADDRLAAGEPQPKSFIPSKDLIRAETHFARSRRRSHSDREWVAIAARPIEDLIAGAALSGTPAAIRPVHPYDRKPEIANAPRTRTPFWARPEHPRDQSQTVARMASSRKPDVARRSTATVAPKAVAPKAVASKAPSGEIANSGPSNADQNGLGRKTVLPAISPFATNRPKSQPSGSKLAPDTAASIPDEKIITSIPSLPAGLSLNQEAPLREKPVLDGGAKNAPSRGFEMPNFKRPELVMPAVKKPDLDARKIAKHTSEKESIASGTDSAPFPNPPRRLQIEMPRRVTGTLEAPTNGSAALHISEPSPVMPSTQEPLSPSDLMASASRSRGQVRKEISRPKRSVILPPVPAATPVAEVRPKPSAAAKESPDRKLASDSAEKGRTATNRASSGKLPVLATAKLKPHRLGSATPASAIATKGSETPDPGLVQPNPFASRPVVELARRTEGTRHGVIRQPVRKRAQAPQSSAPTDAARKHSR